MEPKKPRPVNRAGLKRKDIKEHPAWTLLSLLVLRPNPTKKRLRLSGNVEIDIPGNCRRKHRSCLPNLIHHTIRMGSKPHGQSRGGQNTGHITMIDKIWSQ